MPVVSGCVLKRGRVESFPIVSHSQGRRKVSDPSLPLSSFRESALSSAMVPIGIINNSSKTNDKLLRSQTTGRRKASIGLDLSLN